MWVYPKIYFHPTVPLPLMLSLLPLKLTMPFTSCVCPSAIVAHDVEQATHEGKLNQYPHVWAINQKPRRVKDTRDKVINNYINSYYLHKK